MPVVDAEGKFCKRVISKSSVPWYKEFKSVVSYRSLLEEEVDAFWSFDNEARAEHGALLECIEAAGSCYAVLGGAASLGIHFSEIPLTIDVAFPPTGSSTVPYEAQSAELIGLLAESNSRSEPYSYNVTSIVSDREFVVEIEGGSSTSSVSVLLHPPSFVSLSRRLQNEGNRRQDLRKIVKVVGQVLRQSNLLNNSGGISELGLFVLVLSALKSIEADHIGDDNGTKALILLVLERLGNSFDHNVLMATLLGPAPRLDSGLGKALVNKADPNSMKIPVLFVQDPSVAVPTQAPSEENNFLSCHNLTANCTRFIQVREVFKYCLTMLVKWQHTGNTKQSGKTPYAYKGKSPLSSIISFKHLVLRDKEGAKKEKEAKAKSEPGVSPSSSAGSGSSATATFQEEKDGGDVVKEKDAIAQIVHTEEEPAAPSVKADVAVEFPVVAAVTPVLQVAPVSHFNAFPALPSFFAFDGNIWSQGATAEW